MEEEAAFGVGGAGAATPATPGGTRRTRAAVTRSAVNAAAVLQIELRAVSTRPRAAFHCAQHRRIPPRFRLVTYIFLKMLRVFY